MLLTLLLIETLLFPVIILRTINCSMNELARIPRESSPRSTMGVVNLGETLTMYLFTSSQAVASFLQETT